MMNNYHDMTKQDLMRLFGAAVDATNEANRAQNELYSALFAMTEEDRMDFDDYEKIESEMQQYLMCVYGDVFTLYNSKTWDEIEEMVFSSMWDWDEAEKEEGEE